MSLSFNMNSITDFIKQFTGNNNNPYSGQKDEFSKNNYNNIIGMPPLEWISSNDLTKEVTVDKALRSMMILFIKPAQPIYSGISGDKGNLFTMDTATGLEKYKKILSANDIKKQLVTENGIQVAVQFENSISESWSHEYSDSMFESMMQGFGSSAAEVKAVTGKDIFHGGADIMSDMGKTLSDAVGGGGIGSIASGLGKFGAGAANKAGDYMDGQDKNSLLSKASKLATGSQVDFPMIWRGSSYSPSYSFTVRLYCPDMWDDNSYNTRVIEPLAHLLAFMCPESENDLTFTFPLLVQVKCPGMFMIDAGYISNMDVVKGGEGGDISYDQRAGTVDVRFTVNSLYSTMITKSSFNAQEERPTLQSYLFAMRGKTTKSQDPNPPGGNTSPDGAGFISTTNGESSPLGFTSSLNKNLGLTVNLSSDRKRDLALGVGINLDVAGGRLSIADLEAASDPSINSNRFEQYKSQFGQYSDTLINYVGNSISSKIMDNSITTAESIAIKIRSGVIINDLEILNWFWSNLDQFPQRIQDIVVGITPNDVLANNNPNFNNSFGIAFNSGVL